MWVQGITPILWPFFAALPLVHSSSGVRCKYVGKEEQLPGNKCSPPNPQDIYGGDRKSQPATMQGLSHHHQPKRPVMMIHNPTVNWHLYSDSRSCPSSTMSSLGVESWLDCTGVGTETVSPGLFGRCFNVDEITFKIYWLSLAGYNNIQDIHCTKILLQSANSVLQCWMK